MKRRRKVTEGQIRALQGEEFYRRRERTQRLLAERIAYHRAKAEEKRRALGEG